MLFCTDPIAAWYCVGSGYVGGIQSCSDIDSEDDWFVKCQGIWILVFPHAYAVVCPD